MRPVVALAALAAAALLAGTAAAAERFERHVVPGEGVSLTVPGRWVVVDSRLPDEVVDRLSRENPRLAPFLRGLSQPGSPIRFIALDPVVRAGFATNVNVVVTRVPPGLKHSDYEQALIFELRSLGAKNVKTSTVTIDGERAVRLLYRFQVRLGRIFTVQTLQYGFLRSGRSIVVTYTTLPSQAGRYTATFSRSAASIRFR